VFEIHSIWVESHYGIPEYRFFKSERRGDFNLTAVQKRTFGGKSRVEATCGQIADLAYQLGPGAKLPTILELRESLGVSITTINQALVELEAQNVVLRRIGVGIYVSEALGKPNIALICDPDLFGMSGSSPFWYLLLCRMRDRAALKRESLTFHWAAMRGVEGLNLEAPLMQEIANRRMDGIVAVGLNPATIRWIEEQGVPTVGFATPAPWRVRTDFHAMTKMGALALSEAGCRRIGFWTSVHPLRPQDTVIARQHNYLGTFIETLTASGLPYFPELSEDNLDLVDPEDGMVKLALREQGYRLALKVFDGDPASWPDGLVINDDSVTLGAIIGLASKGLVPGSDVRIASHSHKGSSVLHGYEASLTLMQFDPAEVVETLFHLLEELLAGKQPDQAIAYTKPRLVSRNENHFQSQTPVPSNFRRNQDTPPTALVPVPLG